MHRQEAELTSTNMQRFESLAARIVGKEIHSGQKRSGPPATTSARGWPKFEAKLRNLWLHPQPCAMSHHVTHMSKNATTQFFLLSSWRAHQPSNH